MAKWSKLMKASVKSGKFRRACPFCKATLSATYAGDTYLDKDGKKVRVTLEWHLKRATYQECPVCKVRWPIFARDEDATQRRFVETDRTEEPIGNEIRRIENKTSASVTRTIRASREWTRQIELGLTEESRTSTEAKITSKAIVLTSQMQKSIQKHYDVTASEKQKFDEEIVIDVPANTSIEIIMRWKRIWQNGYLEPGMGYGTLPLKVCIGLTFDLQQRDISGDGMN